MGSNVKSERYVNLDILRIIAAFAVVILHTAAQNIYGITPGNTSWMIFNVYDSMVVFAVPVFFMISGMLFLGKEKEPDIKKLLSKNVLKLVILYFFWSFLYGIDSLGANEAIAHPEKLFGSMLQSKFHLWFLVSMVGVYLLYPILWCLVRYKNGKYTGYACCLFLLFGVLRPTLIKIPFSDPNIVIFICVFGYVLCEYSGYFLLGYYISQKKPKKPRLLLGMLIYAVMVAVAAFVEYLFDVKSGSTGGAMYEKFVLPTCIEAIAVFYVFSNIKVSVSERCAKAVKLASDCTLGIYLLHPFVLEMLNSKFGINTMSIHPLISVPLLALGIFAICFAVTFLIKKIPFVGKWLI